MSDADNLINIIDAEFDELYHMSEDERVDYLVDGWDVTEAEADSALRKFGL